MSYRISVDTGGTFTDVVIAGADGQLHIGKALTTYERAFDGIRVALEQQVQALDVDLRGLLSQTSHFAYGTTRSTNAIVEHKTARTAFLTTAGFPDILLLREGGKIGPFRPREFSPPYVPRHLTFEIDERVDSDGDVFRELDEATVLAAIEQCRRQAVEAVGVCLLWSTVNPAHELRISELFQRELPDVAVTLSHLLNPVVREYRRASATVIDASLKPLMQRFLGELEADLASESFAGRLLVSTSYGGAWPTREMVDRPLYSVGSGPSMAPVAALEVGRADLGTSAPNLLVCDTGGTTFDVGLIRDGEISSTTDTWLGERWTGHITGIKAVDVRSIGAGGGSIVAVDSGGLVHVGPESAGADPGPACYGRGGTRPTVTDAALILGFLEPEGFLGGRLHLDVDAAYAAFEDVAAALGKSKEETAQGALIIATQNVVSAIREITIAQGIDPRDLAVVAGGGAGGLNVVQMARELGCRTVIVPRTAGALSAVGALQADVISEFSTNQFAETRSLDIDRVNAALGSAGAAAETFARQLDPLGARVIAMSASVDARYQGQVWELETPLPALTIRGEDDVRALEAAFHAVHERVFAISEPGQQVECVTWRVRVAGHLEPPHLRGQESGEGSVEPLRRRPVVFARDGEQETPIFDGSMLPAGAEITGPAVILEETSTLVVDPGAAVTVSPQGTYVIAVGDSPALAAHEAFEEVLQS